MQLLRTRAAFAACLIMLASCGEKKEAADDTAPDTAAGEAGGLLGVPNTPVAPAADGAMMRRANLRLGNATLASPSDAQIAMAYYQISGLPTPFDNWAQADSRVRQANEFDRQAAADNVRQELMAAFQAVDGVGFIRINTSMRFGEYDMQAQAYRLDGIDDDRFYSYDFNGANYRLTTSNGAAAQVWRLPQDQARSILQRLPSRNVDVTLVYKIVDAVPNGNGGNLVGVISSYEIFAPQYQGGDKIGEVTVAP